MEFNPAKCLYPICYDCAKELQYKMPNHDVVVFPTLTKMTCFICGKEVKNSILTIEIHKLEFETDITGLKEKEEKEAIKRTLESFRHTYQTTPPPPKY